jgi:hypothetical protein
MEWLTHIGAFIAGLGAGWTLKVVISNRSKKFVRQTRVSQSNNTAGGDIVGGDVSVSERNSRNG